MAVRATQIKTEILEILQNCTIQEDKVFLPAGHLDRPTYLEVDKALRALGGKWNRYAKAHVFESPESALGLMGVIETGLLVDPKLNDYFPTPASVLGKIMAAAKLERGMWVLEPSAGRGVILIQAGAVVGDRQVQWCENLPANEKFLQDTGWKNQQLGSDFLEVNPRSLKGFDRVLMNPPFRGAVYATHILHAWEFVAPGGRLVSVAPSGVTFRNDSLTRRLRDLIADKGEVVALPEGSFKNEGTMVNTVLITLNK